MVNIRPLHPGLQKKANEELGETPERLEESLKLFRAWIKKSPHLKARTDDQWLTAFLRGSKFSLERAKEKFELYYCCKTHIPELMQNRDPMDDRVLAAIRAGVGLSLPILETPDGPRYFFIRPGCYDADKFTIEEIMKISTMIGDVLMNEDDNFIISGQVGILDFKDITVGHFLKFHPGFIKKMTTLQQDAVPIRQKGTHFVNTPKIFEATFNIFKSFTHEKNRKRFYVYGDDMEALYKAIPRRLLPSEYGGEAGSIQSMIDANEKKFMEYRQYFIDDDQYGVVEKLRVGAPKNPESLFGIEGSFRQLAID